MKPLLVLCWRHTPLLTQEVVSVGGSSGDTVGSPGAKVLVLTAVAWPTDLLLATQCLLQAWSANLAGPLIKLQLSGPPVGSLTQSHSYRSPSNPL